ncbi:MAG: GNAT family N-acetyltransferase [Flavobacteriaceae bacterium]|nr:GNAT family N-acetyltransferase [Flavobacteriaceae bacterium]
MLQDQVHIVPFESAYAKDFARLNIEWLEKFFAVEPHDVELMEDCEANIIGKGGHIFFAKLGDEVVGTVALIPLTKGVFELGKMAVSSQYQGLKIGQLLMKRCIDFGRGQGWSKIVLYSNTTLQNAIYIYRKYGFVEVEMEENPPYERGDIKMEFVIE